MKFLVFAALIVVSAGSIMQYPAKIGDFIEIPFGPDARTWKRQLNGGEVQFLKACANSDNSDRCTHWSDEDGVVLLSSPKSRAFNNGTLHIYHFGKSDVGTYSSPEIKGRTFSVPGGGIGGVAGPVVDVFIQE
ncbi:unnamed protein product, partial [Mesorhabditis belari]|uniref:Uncharacterized protein n=1 Tax=Mesorhabditis belari TaxID=2138241 RepID=A0AAF3JB06_9BILA